MIWLGIDTANTPLSVAVVQDGVLVAERNSSLAVNHSLRAMAVIEEVCKEAGLSPQEIDAIAVSEGPGSYTGVRIGVTIAKTLAYTLNKPLYGVSSLLCVAANAFYFNGVVCSLFDARRQHVYAGAYDSSAGRFHTVMEDGHYSIETVVDKMKALDKPVLFIGKDAAMHEEYIKDQMQAFAQFAPFPLDLPRASVLIWAAEQSGVLPVPAHAFTPEYRRISEAEANWLAQQRKEQSDGQ